MIGQGPARKRLNIPMKIRNSEAVIMTWEKGRHRMSSHAPPHYQCPFCAIVRGEERDDVATRQEDIVLRASEVTAFISSHQWPNNPGHVLVIPNEHKENIYSLPDALAIPLQSTVRSIALALKTAFDCPETSTRQHNEPAGGQDVWHYHIHVFPRYPSDGLYGSQRQRIPPELRKDQALAIWRVLDQNELSGMQGATSP